MADELPFSENVRDKVKVLEPVQPADMAEWHKLQEALDKSHKLRAVVQSWQEQQNAERPLRTKFAWGLFWLAFIQVLALFLFAFLLGFKVIEVQEWVAVTFLLGVFAETIALVLIVTKYLFPERSQQVLETIEKL